MQQLTFIRSSLEMTQSFAIASFHYMKTPWKLWFVLFPGCLLFGGIFDCINLYLFLNNRKLPGPPLLQQQGGHLHRYQISDDG